MHHTRNRMKKTEREVTTSRSRGRGRGKWIQNIPFKPPEGCELPTEELEKVIAERKAERKRTAEENRLEGLRRIAEMKSRDGLHPVEDLFPEEIWIKILGNPILGPQDRYNMCLVHPFFDALMQETKIADILLPLVLHHVFSFWESFRLATRSMLCGSHRKEEFKFVTLRLVSKGVKDAVDKWFEDDIVYRIKNSLSYTSSCPSLRIDDPNLESEISFYTFGAPKKLFRRSLLIDFDLENWILDTEDEEERMESKQRFERVLSVFNDSITEFLEKVGDQVFYIYFRAINCIGVEHLEMSVPKFHNIVRGWLLLLPNLKWLDIYAPGQNWEGNADCHDDQAMPRINALERVDVHCNRNGVLDADTLLPTNPHVKYFSNDAGSLKEVHPRVSGLPLEDLKMHLEDDDPNAKQDKKVLQIFMESSWKLKSIDLTINNGTLDVVLRCLQEKFPTLEKVSLTLRNYSVGTNLDFLRLPRLKDFEISLGTCDDFIKDLYFLFDLHFLFYCSELEFLTWANSTEMRWISQIKRELLRRNQNRRLINFPGEGVQLQEVWDSTLSNVWKVYRKLKLIKLRLANSPSYRRCTYYRP